ncbi:hypothetical protein D9757_007334 [Collybiopsis confluens]|uniref:Uncharacterized protein n=1 Tax=Collybiopsis confluens TaxID=2823264 RepID=A0A8H5HGB6_9AGAR|nr:hypothetical protein D9757_007334 [Collybiopsis confluens]
MRKLYPTPGLLAANDKAQVNQVDQTAGIKTKGRDKRAPLPSPDAVVALVRCIKCLVKLKAVLKFILEFPGVEPALRAAEVSQGIVDDDLIQKVRVPGRPSPPYFSGSSHDMGNDVPGDEDNRAAEGASVEEITVEDQTGTRGRSFQIYAIQSHSATRFLRMLSAISAWILSADALSSQVDALIAKKKFSVLLYQCPPATIPRYDDQFRQQVNRCFTVPLTLGQVSQVQKRINKAKIHAEAQLMAWAFHDLTLGSEVPIAISKKCCFLCRLLGQILSEGNSPIKFFLPGSHHQIFAWIPPPGIPDTVLMRLRDALLAVIRELTGSHTRQSSSVSSDLRSFSKNDHENQEINNMNIRSLMAAMLQ